MIWTTTVCTESSVSPGGARACRAQSARQGLTDPAADLLAGSRLAAAARNAGCAQMRIRLIKIVDRGVSHKIRVIDVDVISALPWTATLGSQRGLGPPSPGLRWPQTHSHNSR